MNPSEDHPAPHDWSDLRARIASGVILGALGVIAALAGGPWIAGAAGAAVVAMSYEWARMSEPEDIKPAFEFVLAGALGSVMFSSRAALDVGIAWLIICALFSALRRKTLLGALETMLGLLYVGAPCAIFLWFRYQPFGLEFVLSLFAIIWSADIAAYFGGKLIGGRRISEALSPNKTWSGIAAGVAAGAVAGIFCGLWLSPHAWSSLWIVAGAGIAFVGLMGDLFEFILETALWGQRREPPDPRSWRRLGPDRWADDGDARAGDYFGSCAAHGQLLFRTSPMSISGRSVSILGVTGSVGQSTIAVIAELRGQGIDIPVEAVTAGKNLGGLIAACKILRPRFAAIADENLLLEAREALSPLGIEIGAGESALAEAAERPAQWVMSAIVGAAGLKPTLKAIERGAMVALANKETLVCAGALMLNAAKASGATLLPVDSEHNAIFQCLSGPQSVERITLTASGGPFRTWTLDQMADVTPAQACAHPTWSMGAKISVDSATLMNKGLELIEAAYLFSLEEGRIGVLVHPQSIVHSLVHYCDGSVLAQMSAPDMRTPIAHALAWPDRAHVSTARLDLAQLGSLTFEAPDEMRFPALALARACLKAGPAHVAAMNAANEVAVAAFLSQRVGFLDIAALVEEAVAALGASEANLIAKTPSSFDEVYAIDAAARRAAERLTMRSGA